MNLSQPSRSSSRRDFLKRSAGAAAASVLAGVVIPHVHAAENNTIKLALIGCGGRGTGAVADAFSTTGGPVKLYAMADLFEDRLNASLKNLSGPFADKLDVPPERRFVGFDAFKKAIDCLGPGDVAMLTTHAVFRPMHFEYAVQKGVNVFMEKSFAVDSPATRRLLKAAEESERKNLKVGCGFMWRHSKARQEVIRRIHDGAIGDVLSLRIYRVHGPVYTPKLPPNTNEIVFQLRNAPCFNWTSSGFFIDWHCHNIDVACWAKGAWPVTAQGMGGRCYPECGNLFDHYTVEYTFADGAKLYAFSRHMQGCWETYSDYAHGSKGSAVIMTNLSQPLPKIYKSQRMVDEDLVWKYAEPDNNPYHQEWQVLLDAIRQNKPHNEARRAAEANFAALMGRTAVHTGKMVTWDEQIKSDFQFVADIDHLTFESPAPIKAGPDGIYPCPQPGRSGEC
ncbi:MAG: Gfo/Idh/MocA family oxidoreductase [Thermoguttaceae bacterium]|jgi:predicted dehydrogenase|nr:Gfo/Idh/MocA family oxidoreductase [Thermoguttaceae bacterium]